MAEPGAGARKAHSAAVHLIVFALIVATPLLLLVGVLLYRSVTLESERIKPAHRPGPGGPDRRHRPRHRSPRRHPGDAVDLALAGGGGLAGLLRAGQGEPARQGLSGVARRRGPPGHQHLRALRRGAGGHRRSRRRCKGCGRTARPVVSDLFTSLVVRQPVYNISIPVLRGNEVRFVMSLGLAARGSARPAAGPEPAGRLVGRHLGQQRRHHGAPARPGAAGGHGGPAAARRAAAGQGGADPQYRRRGGFGRRRPRPVVRLDHRGRLPGGVGRQAAEGLSPVLGRHPPVGGRPGHRPRLPVRPRRSPRPLAAATAAAGALGARRAVHHRQFARPRGQCRQRRAAARPARHRGRVGGAAAERGAAAHRGRGGAVRRARIRCRPRSHAALAAVPEDPRGAARPMPRRAFEAGLDFVHPDDRERDAAAQAADPERSRRPVPARVPHPPPRRAGALGDGSRPGDPRRRRQGRCASSAWCSTSPTSRKPSSASTCCSTS